MNFLSHQPGAKSGLTVVLAVNQTDYVYANSAAAGFHVS